MYPAALAMAVAIPTAGRIAGGGIVALENDLAPAIEDGHLFYLAARGAAKHVENIIMAIAIRGKGIGVLIIIFMGLISIAALILYFTGYYIIKLVRWIRSNSTKNRQQELDITK